LAAELDIPGTALAPVLQCLERGGLIVVTEKEHFLPGRALESIRLIDVIDAVRTQQPGRLMIDLRRLPPAARVMTEVESAIRDRLAAQSIKDLIAAA
jgi:DNA-binding IscR family transcriptional regulator